MKISIITVLNTVNYGSALQTFATQNFFEKLGAEVEFVDYWRKDQTVKEQIKYIVFDKKKNILQWIKKPLRDLLRVISVWKAYKCFRGFIKEHIHITAKGYNSIDDLKRDVPEADIYCTGSDQMWNSNWNQGIERSFFLEYAPVDKKRIAFATSIGKTAIDDAEAAEIMPLIRKYDFITMREQSAVNILNKYNISSEMILDPTLLFSREQWEEHISAKKREKPYLLVYQLHQSHRDINFDDVVKRIANNRKLEIVRIVYSYADRKFGSKVCCPSVFDFLSLLYYADYIVTDSFHGTAFSINFNRLFFVVYPNSYSTRMDNILEFAGLQNRRFSKETEDGQIGQAMDFSNVNDKLNHRRREIYYRFESFLTTSEESTERGYI